MKVRCVIIEGNIRQATQEFGSILCPKRKIYAIVAGNGRVPGCGTYSGTGRIGVYDPLTGTGGIYSYEMKDHLGNIRAVIVKNTHMDGGGEAYEGPDGSWMVYDNGVTKTWYPDKFDILNQIFLGPKSIDNSLTYNVWNSKFARFITPDFINVGGGFSGIFGTGASVSVEANIMEQLEELVIPF